ncbi:MAG: zf-TFIIB domain-containing protein [Kofleriaceae bacterium]
MDPYRTPGRTCPNCPGAALREFQDRYICDNCQGILIGVADFTSAAADLIHATPAIEYRDEEPTNTPCPLCERPLSSCLLVINASDKTAKPKDRVLRCAHDGLWFGEGVLATMFALISRRWYQPTFPDPLGGGEVGRDGIMHRSGPATQGLRISDWRARPRARAKTLSPVNAYADRTLACPACATALQFLGDRYVCESCTGVFVENAPLIAMVSEMTRQLWALPAAIGSAGPRACPICQKALGVELLEGVTIDRCLTHGVWFDQAELGAALAHVTGELDPGLRAWLRRLFT